MDPQKMECKNCNKVLEKSYDYCPYCGQKANFGRLNFKQLLKDLWKAFSDADKGLLILIKQLIARPGHVARDYIFGRRKKHFNPFSFLAIMVAITLFFILQFENIGLNYTQITTGDAELLRFSFKYFNLFILLMCPIYGIVIWLLFWGNQINFVENLVLSAYLSGQTMVYYIVALIFFIIFPSSINILGVIIGILISLWYIMAILQFYRTKSFWSILKSISVIIIAQLISQGLLLSIFSIYSKFNF